MDVDGIVNPTDPNLTLTDNLQKHAGPSVQAACEEIGWCTVGSAVITSAGNLPSKHIIHAVGPRWGEGSERGKLVSTMLRCLDLAEENGLKSLAIPPISTGVMGFPMESCARVILGEIIDYTYEDLRNLRVISIVVSNALELNVFKAEFARLIEQLQSNGEGKVRV
jgi:O-acetyl-ADP-ribose deacetylase (regulator of RNase III)